MNNITTPDLSDYNDKEESVAVFTHEDCICPSCKNKVTFNRDGDNTYVSCTSCDDKFIYRDGIVHFNRWSKQDNSSVSINEYAGKYQESQAAESYNEKYKKSGKKRKRTAQEINIIRNLLDGQKHCRKMLDLPCGGGRLSHLFAEHTETLIEADISSGQLQYNRKYSDLHGFRFLMTADVMNIPLRDNAVNGTVCIRLLHHFFTPPEREALVTELLRVSKEFVLVSFSDADSIKNRLRSLTGRAIKKNRVSRKEIDEIARRNDARLVASPAISRMGSCHRYALLVK